MMIVNELATKSGVSSNTIRYYSKIGLLEPNRDQNNGYKLFRPEDVHKLKFIQQAKDLGFTLNHIKEMLRRVKQGEMVCDLAREQIVKNIAECESEIGDLKDKKRKMVSALDQWKQLPSELPNEQVWCHLIEKHNASKSEGNL